MHVLSASKVSNPSVHRRERHDFAILNLIDSLTEIAIVETVVSAPGISQLASIKNMVIS